MTTIDQMWTRLAAHQPVADERGYGPEWHRMCEERTEEAEHAAWEAAWGAESYGAALAADAAKTAERWANRAVEHIERAEGKQ